jgi:hypothetical protein
MKTSWTDCVGYEKVLQIAKEEGNIVHEIKMTKGKWIGNMLRRNCFLKHIIEGTIKRGIEVTGRQG